MELQIYTTAFVSHVVIVLPDLAQKLLCRGTYFKMLTETTSGA